MTLNQLDPRGVIKDSYAISGITEEQCRSIFLDWVIGLAADAPVQEQIAQLLAHYGDSHPDHPMTKTLKSGLERPAEARRRGGRNGRLGQG
ncbi:MAG: hypothetical protein CSA68_07235 [Rhodobacterales bacterium]|nr:MAG: hypothetical protein CSA68_07235 [Rhodobacterales bacterium]